MDNIIDFPIEPVRSWVKIERELRDNLARNGASTEFQNIVMGHAKDFYELINFDLKIPINGEFPNSLSADQINGICSSIEKNIRVSLEEQLQAFTYKIFIDRVYREIAVCRDTGLV
jgi:hypothetical protein